MTAKNLNVSTEDGMQEQLKKLFLKQIDDVLAYQDVMREEAKYDDASGLPSWEYDRIKTMALAAISQIAGDDSVYSRRANEASRVNPNSHSGDWGSLQKRYQYS